VRARRIAGSTTLALALVAGLSACGGGDEAAGNSVAADCTPAHDFPTVEDGVLTVSTYVSPPYTALDRAGSDVSGVDGEIVRRIAEKECLTVQANPVTGAALIESLSSGRADVAIGGVYRTPEREDTLSLSDTMYRDGMALLSASGASSLDDLKGKKVGVIQGYLWNEDLQNVLGADEVTVYQDADSMLADLESGRVDATVLTTAEAAFRAKQSGADLKVEEMEADDRVASSTAPGEVILAMQDGADQMATAFSEDIQSLLGDGTIAEILSGNGIDTSLAGSAPGN
jgi:polar amino acid transport system substrate-binding protein